MTRLPTAAAPANLNCRQSSAPTTVGMPIEVRLPVETDASNVRKITSYTPTALARWGAKTTRFPTAAAPLNL
eukprot:7389167-Prymnesium_polylepis.1